MQNSGYTFSLAVLSYLVNGISPEEKKKRKKGKEKEKKLRLKINPTVI